MTVWGPGLSNAPTLWAPFDGAQSGGNGSGHHTPQGYQELNPGPADTPSTAALGAPRTTPTVVPGGEWVRNALYLVPAMGDPKPLNFRPPSQTFDIEFFFLSMHPGRWRYRHYVAEGPREPQFVRLISGDIVV